MSSNSRLIRSDDLWEFCCEAAPDKITGAFTKGQSNIIQRVKEAAHNPSALPGVDAVKVVRCKNCARKESIENGKIWCAYNGGHAYDPNDFCSLGVLESKED